MEKTLRDCSETVKHMAKADSKRLPFSGIETIDSLCLEVFPLAMKEVRYNETDNSAVIVERNDITTVKKQLIRYETPEFSALCPFSGLPDFGDVLAEYVPGRWVLELKSYKYYLLSYRNVGIYQEHVTQRIYEDLEKILVPDWLRITTTYRTRGGINTTCCIDSKGPDSSISIKDPTQSAG